MAGEEAKQGELERRREALGSVFKELLGRKKDTARVRELLEQQKKLSNSTYLRNIKGFPSGSVVKHPPAKEEMWV